MGQLRTRKRGKTWEWSFEGAKINGKRNSISRGGYRTKADAIAAGTKAKAEYDNSGRTFTPSELSVSDYLDYWLENYVKKNLAYNTYLDYETKCRIHIKSSLGMYRLSSLEPDVIQKWIDGKKMEGYSKNSVGNILSVLSGALNYAVAPCQYLSANPCNFVKRPKIKDSEEMQQKREYVCNKKDFDLIMNLFPCESNFYLPLMLGYNLGTRIGETYGFDLLEDIDLNAGTIRILHQLKKEDGIWFYRSPKYDSRRTIKMGNTISQIIKAEIRRQKKNRLRYGDYYTKTYLMPDSSILQARADIQITGKEIWPICVKENGELLTPESFKYCARVIHSAGLPYFHSHCLRHTHGTILAENGISAKTIMERLGHKDISTTLGKYVFNTEKMQDNSVEVFEKVSGASAYILK